MLAALPWVAPAEAAGAVDPGSGPASRAADVTDLALEDLLQMEVTSPGKKEERLASVPAAIYVIRSEDLRRLGVTCLPEALRMVPGFHVIRSNASNWTISSRGFDSGNANKLLVLIDGRTVYSNLQSGVFWDVQDTLLEDIDRIEVIRGPGGTLWGTNAVNGVVNVITKRAQDTQGLSISSAVGQEMRAQLGARYGFALSEDHAVRIWAKYLDLDDSVGAFDADRNSHDGLAMKRAGFRSDWKSGEQDRFTLQGDAYAGQARLVLTLPSLTAPFSSRDRDRSDVRGGNLLWRWSRQLEGDSALELQLYLDDVSRLNDAFAEHQSTADLEFQHRLRPFPSHDVVWGLGYRVARNAFDGSFFVALDPDRRTDDILSAFVQDQIELVADRLSLVLGTKLEHGDYSHLEVMPNARLAWTIHPRQMAWLAASRAVRAPSLLDVDFRINALTLPTAPPTVQAVFGTRNFDSEKLTSLEAGYRTRPLDALSLDLALFYSFYDRLRSLEPGAVFAEADPAPLHDVAPFFIRNENRARAYGMELAANVQAAPWWLLSASYTHVYLNLTSSKRSRDPVAEQDEDRSPRNQIWIRSSMDLPWSFSLDLSGRYVGRTPANGLRSYAQADARLAWHDRARKLEIALVGQNLLHDRQAEVASPAARTGSAIERGFYVLFSRRF